MISYWFNYKYILSVLFVIGVNLSTSCGQNHHITSNDSPSTILNRPLAITSIASPNVNFDLNCLEIPNGFDNSNSSYDPECVNPTDKEVRYKIYLKENGNSQTLVAEYPSASAFANETTAFSAAGTSGNYANITVSDWPVFIGQALNYNDEICISNITKNCSAAGAAESFESTHQCFNWFGRQVFNFTGVDQSPPIMNPAPSSIYSKIWGAGGGAASTAIALSARTAKGGAGGYTKYKGNWNSNFIIIVGEGGLSAIDDTGGLATYGGGGAGGDGDGGGLNRDGSGSGGGLSGIFLSTFTQVNSVAIAGGGGGGGVATGSSQAGNGGAGGGLTAGTGTYSANPSGGGGAGSQLSAGGNGGPLQGGAGANAGQGNAGGGGGYYGGGGGTGSGFAEQGGGGGSGFLVNSNACSSLSTSSPTTATSYLVKNTIGSTPEGSLDIDYDGLAGKTTYGNDGENGLIIIYWIP